MDIYGQGGTDPTRNVPVYNVGPQALSAAERQAIDQKRVLADTALGLARNQFTTETASKELAAQRRRESEERSWKRRVEDEQRRLGGRGTATFGMTSGRFQRRAGEDYGLALGEIDSDLQNDLMALQQMLERAELERDITLANIKLEEASLSTKPMGFFPAANMY